jgi:hypothetical protein
VANPGVATGRLGEVPESLVWWQRAAAGDERAAGKLCEARDDGLGDLLD